MRILIGEDDTASRLILEAAVRRLGHEALGVSDGDEAWRLYQEVDVDAVISDRVMPRSDGLQLCRLIRRSKGGEFVYFIFLTSSKDEASSVDGMKTGADDYLKKPLDMLELSSQLLVTLALQHSTRIRCQAS
jgi:DNA-binding response OmpR family regulator